MDSKQRRTLPGGVSGATTPRINSEQDLERYAKGKDAADVEALLRHPYAIGMDAQVAADRFVAKRREAEASKRADEEGALRHREVNAGERAAAAAEGAAEAAKRSARYALLAAIVAAVTAIPAMYAFFKGG